VEKSIKQNGVEGRFKSPSGVAIDRAQACCFTLTELIAERGGVISQNAVSGSLRRYADHSAKRT
jgi:hypothetical protein